MDPTARKFHETIQRSSWQAQESATEKTKKSPNGAEAHGTKWQESQAPLEIIWKQQRKPNFSTADQRPFFSENQAIQCPTQKITLQEKKPRFNEAGKSTRGPKYPR
jgi:hypothetical protein